MLRCFAIERRGNSVSLGELRWAIATLRDLGRTSAEALLTLPEPTCRR